MKRRLAAAGWLLALGACASSKRVEAPPPAPPPAPAPLQQDASYDWHVLLVAPFGSVVREVPYKLHEVLLFKDQASPAADSGECYASESPPPTFLKRTPTEFLLCFQHDHLARIEAVVLLPKDEVRDIMSSACLLWHAKAKDSAPATAPPCVGSDGTVHYEAHLEEEAEGGEVPLSLKLEQVAPPES